MPSLKDYLRSWGLRIGAPKAEGCVSYSVPQRTTEDLVFQNYTAPFDGFVNVASWYVYAASIENMSIQGTLATFSAGKVWGGSTENADFRNFIPVRKGDNIKVSLRIKQGQEAHGSISFFPRCGAS